jgi:hypothetical protein
MSPSRAILIESVRSAAVRMAGSEGSWLGRPTESQPSNITSNFGHALDEFTHRETDRAQQTQLNR